MNRIAARNLLAAAAMLASTAALAQPEAPVPVQTDGLPSHLRARVEQVAAQGQTALIQYLNRLRMMGYQIRVEELVKPRAEETVKPKADERAKPEQEVVL